MFSSDFVGRVAVGQAGLELDARSVQQHRMPECGDEFVHRTACGLAGVIYLLDRLIHGCSIRACRSGLR